MKAVMARLVHSKASFSRLRSVAVLKYERSLSSSSGQGDCTSKVQEAETVELNPPPTEKLLVLGGNGFVGSHICREALDHGLTVSSLSRSGRSSLSDSWAERIVWHQGDLLSPNSLKHALHGVSSVISCVGGFGSNSYMYKINGSANINAIKAAAEQGVKRFVYISAADFGLLYYVLRGYYEGKRATETELVNNFPYQGVILRPGFIHGSRQVGNMTLPLSVIGAPLEMVFKRTKPLSKIPVIGPLFIPPVNVTSVAKVAVRAATNHSFPPGILDAYDILEHSSPSS